MELTTENLKIVAMECMAHEDDTDLPTVVKIMGVIHTFFFEIEKITNRMADIRAMLDQLHNAFKENMGGGWSFLNACLKNNDEQWTGLQADMELLFALGMAAGLVKETLPQDMRSTLPGGVPYYTILSDPLPQAENV